MMGARVRRLVAWLLDPTGSRRSGRLERAGMIEELADEMERNGHRDTAQRMRAEASRLRGDDRNGGDA